MNKLRILFATAILALAGSILGQGSPRLVTMQMEPPRVLASATAIGPKPATDNIHITVGLQLADRQGLSDFVDSVSNPTSPTYRQFITPDEVGRRFGLSMAEVQKVVDYLTSQGMKVTGIAKSRITLSADATVAQAQAAFHTSIENYSVPAYDGFKAGQFFSFTTPPALPSTIAFDIQSISGLENVVRPKHTSLNPTQLQTLYSVSPEYNNGNQGQGRTVGITNFDGFTIANEQVFVNYYKLPAPAAGAGSNITVYTIDGGSQNVNSGQGGEGNLDLQTVISMAPLCNLLEYDAAGTVQGYLDALTKESNDNSADIITESYGWTLDPTTTSTLNGLHLTMNAAGITYMAASGDHGTMFGGSGSAIRYYYPAIDPEVLSIGGTSVTLNADNTRQAEVGWWWGSTASGAGGGGWYPNTDATYPINVHPTWQTGTGVPSAASVPYRLIPDISFDADPNTGYTVVMYSAPNYYLYVIGGTSGASPCCAGSLADTEQNLIAMGALPADGSGHHRLGRLQDLIYYLNGDPNVFFDVTSGQNGTLPNGQTSVATAGWDTDTGWGAVIWSGFATKYASIGAVSSVALNPSTVQGGVSSTGTVTLSTAAVGLGTTVYLTSNNSVAQVPASVTVAAGATTATFTVTTSTVTNNQSVSITATVLKSSASATLTVQPIGIQSVTISPSSIVGGNPFTTSTVTLTAPALAGGVTVNLSSNNSAVQVPATVTIGSGGTSATFSTTTTGVNTSTSATVTATYSGSTGSANVTVTPAVPSTLGIAPSTVVGGASGTITGTVTLTGQAGPSGNTITMTSSNTSAATVPASMTVAAGATTGTFTVTTLPVTSTQTVTITATGNGTSVTQTITVNPNTVSSLSLNPTTVIGGNTSTGTVTIGQAAGPSGVTVNLSSSGGDAQVPATVTVPSGATTTTFTVTTNQVNSNETLTITAAIGSSTQTANITLQGSGISSVAISPTSIVGGNVPSGGTVTLSGAAPTGGVTVTLSSASSAVTVPASVTVAGGATTATFGVTTAGVDASTPVVVTATLNGGSKTCTLTVTPASAYSLTITPNTVIGGSSTTVTANIHLNGRAGPSGSVVTLLSSNTSAATVPATVTIPAQTSNTNFTITTLGVSSAQTVTISATKTTTVTGTLTVNPGGLSSVSVSPTSIVGGNSPTGTVTLLVPAPTGGTVVNLSANSSSVTVPSSVTVAAGATTATFGVTTSGVASSTPVTITATSSGVTKTCTLTLLPASASTLTITPGTVVGGSATVVTANIHLNGRSGPSGTVVTLSSSNTSAATVPATVTIPANTSNTNFTITTGIVASSQVVTISATATTTVTGTLTVNPAGLSSVSISPVSIVGGNSPSGGTVTLINPAPAGGAVVSLSSGSSSVTVPASVTVAAGATTGTFSVTTSGVDASTPVTISATYNSTTKTCTLTLLPASAYSMTVSPSTVVGGSSTTVTGNVHLNGRSGPSGTVVSLSSSNTAVASVPATVTIPANTSNVNFTVTTFSVASAQTVTLSGTKTTTVSTTLTVNPGSLASVAITPTSIVGGNSPSGGTVTLAVPAPPGGVTVSLASNNACVTVPASVTIGAGATTGTWSATTSGVDSSTPVTITATLNSTSKTCTLTVLPASAYTLTLYPSSVKGGTTLTANIHLNGRSGPSGTVVTLGSADTSLATVPATVTIPPNTSNTNFSITTFAVGTTSTVTISGTATKTVTATLTLTP
ncbi:MAG: protease pro-enzyme activation domain-containing protein [Fimbriimonas sp.]|nr:protease pro-enzyme activation domain-containing protein [Fimbriimonas sp.]